MHKLYPVEIRVDFLHVCVKFTQLKFVWFLWKFYIFTMISCMMQIERILLFRTVFEITTGNQYLPAKYI